MPSFLTGPEGSGVVIIAPSGFGAKTSGAGGADTGLADVRMNSRQEWEWDNHQMGWEKGLQAKALPLPPPHSKLGHASRALTRAPLNL